jgi:hypothetical protein
MERYENGDVTTEYGKDPETGQYRLRQSIRGSLVLDVSAKTREEVLSAARIFVLHELVKRDDVREKGVHEPCEACELEAEMAKRG